MSAAVEQDLRPDIHLTEAAISQVRHLIARKGDQRLGLRIAVQGGGCSGLSYKLDLQTEPTSRDFVYEFDGLTVMVDDRSARFLSGLNLDYSTKNLLEGGWSFQNPNADRTCGCGTSFTPKE